MMPTYLFIVECFQTEQNIGSVESNNVLMESTTDFKVEIQLSARSVFHYQEQFGSRLECKVQSNQEFAFYAF
jgi:hypothetical protein